MKKRTKRKIIPLSVIYREATLSLSVAFLALSIVVGLCFGVAGVSTEARHREMLSRVCSKADVGSGTHGEYVEEIRSLAEEAGQRYFVDTALVLAVIAAESNCRARARSRVGARGLMQLMPATAAEMGIKDLDSMRSNIFGGTRYLSHLLKKFSDLDVAVAAYNSGPTTVRRHKGVPPYKETQAYVEKVLRYYRDFGGTKAYRI